MDPVDVSEFSKAINSLPKQGPGRVVFQEFEISVELCNDTSGPLGELLDSVKLTSPVMVAWKFNPNSTITKTDHSSNDEILNSTEIPEGTRKDSENIDSGASGLEGSPLKLVAIADLSLISPGVVTTKPESVKIKKYEAVSAKQARYLLSLYNTLQRKRTKRAEDLLKPLWVLCDWKKPGQVVCMSVSTTKLSDSIANTVSNYAHRGTQVTMMGPQPIQFYTENLPLKKTEAAKFISCQAQYDIIGSLAKESPMGGLQGMIKLEVKWNAGHCLLLQSPPVDAQVMAKIQVACENNRTAGYKLYSELDLLRRLIESLSTAEICWEAQDSAHPLIDELRSLLENLALGDAKRVKSESICDTTGAKSSQEWIELEERNDLDFTDYMWIMLKKSSSFSELVDCFQLIFSQVKSGKLQPMVHRNNKTSMAQLMRDSYTGRVYFPPLTTGTLAIEFLAEMGAEKLTMDYVNAFLSKDLTSPKHLEYFVQRDLPLAEKFERLEKLHCILELMIILKTFLYTPEATLSMCAWQSLQYLETNKLDWDRVFEVPIPMQSVTKLLDNRQPNIWQSCETKSRGSIKESVIRRLSCEMPFQHLDQPTAESVFDSSQCDTDLEYYMVTIKDNVLLF